MHDPNSRVVEVDRQWYRQLLGYLEPEERWRDQDGMILYAVLDPYKGDTRCLVFVAKK